jgi:hypothetical protein
MTQERRLPVHRHGHARRAEVSTHAAFILAYEAFYSLALAVLMHHRVRVREGRGHRATPGQLMMPLLGLEATLPGAGKVVVQAQTNRNTSTYERPFPPVSRHQVADLIRVVEVALPQALLGLVPDTPIEPALGCSFEQPVR